MGYDTHKSETSDFDLKWQISQLEKAIKIVDAANYDIKKVGDDIGVDTSDASRELRTLLNELTRKRQILVEGREEFFKDLLELFDRHRASMHIHTFVEWTDADIRIRLNSEPVMNLSLEDNPQGKPLDIIKSISEAEKLI